LTVVVDEISAVSRRHELHELLRKETVRAGNARALEKQEGLHGRLSRTRNDPSSFCTTKNERYCSMKLVDMKAPAETIIGIAFALGITQAPVDARGERSISVRERVVPAPAALVQRARDRSWSRRADPPSDEAPLFALAGDVAAFAQGVALR